ncbi:cytochrome P450 [Armillaria luteobubalina]|uniref:Cytochrome P450 n=1 Tax=Armillaria luteobubalina TaxID=153913 RepID=A0AA39P5K9_9AGAR|nr:cytochrome P450 [Armillaria luteobubalina]
MAWYQQYGAIYCTCGCFRQDILSVADPKVLQYIFHLSGYGFPRTRYNHPMAEALIGKGIVAVEGSDHQWQWRILGPAFAASQLRLFLKVFQECAQKLTEKTNKYIREGKEIDMLQWTNKVLLDIIGISMDSSCTH